MKKQIRFLALKGARLTACVSLVAALSMSLSACCVRHEYSASTCALPGVCAKCGKVSEEPLPDHQWAEADCTTPKTCKVCGKTEGEAGGYLIFIFDDLAVLPADVSPRLGHRTQYFVRNLHCSLQINE